MTTDKNVPSGNIPVLPPPVPMPPSPPQSPLGNLFAYLLLAIVVAVSGFVFLFAVCGR